jgi:hypothetical protein
MLRMHRLRARLRIAVAKSGAEGGGVGAVSEKSITRHQAALVRRTKTRRRNPADLAGACSGGRLFVPRAGQAYDVHESEIQIGNRV